MHEHKLTSSHFFMNYSFLLTLCSIQLVSCSLFLIYVSPTSVLQVAIAQQQSSLESSQAMIKGLLSEANHTLESGNSNKTVENLLMVQRLVAQTNDNSTSIQDSMLLIRETVGAILSGRSDIAKANLNLINKQLIKQTPSNETSKAITGPLEKAIPSIPSNESTVPSNETSKTITGPLEKAIPSIPSNESTVPSNKTSKTITGPLEKAIPSIPSNESTVPSNETSKTITGPLEKAIPSIPSNESTVPSNETSKAITGPLEKAIPSIPSNESTVPSNETSKTITGPLEKAIPSIPSNESTVPSNETSKTITGPLEKAIPSIPSNESTVPSNETSKTITGPLEKAIPSIPSNESTVPSNETSKTIDNGTTMGFQTYQNNIFGIKIRYPDSWSVRSYPYNNGSNNTVVGFYSPSKTASQLGNISGVSGHFVPYLDIFAFDSKNMSLDKIINGRINRIQNTSDFVLDSKPFTLKGNRSAHMLVYSTITGGDEFFKKMQVYTIFGNKVYLITFTAQEALFSNYLPTVRKMIDSFEIDL